MLQEGQAKQPAGDAGGLKHPFPMPLSQQRLTLDPVDGNNTGGEEWRRKWGQNQEKWGRQGEEVCPGRLEQVHEQQFWGKKRVLARTVVLGEVSTGDLCVSF